MKAEELYELRIGARVTQKELATHLGIDRRIAERSKDRSSGAYVNLHKSAYEWHLACWIPKHAEFDKIFMAWYCSPYGKENL